MTSRPPHRSRSVVLVVLGVGVLLGAAGAASGSICMCGSPRDPALRVSSSGSAEVSWTTRQGDRRHAVVSPRGRVTFGARIRHDASRRARSARLPLRAMVRRTPDGRLWALQLWRPRRDGRLELRFSRWSGKPTQLAVQAVRISGREVVRGSASFHGRPLYGTQETRGGRVRIGVYVDCFRCALNPRGWARATRVRTHGPNGTFAVRIRPRWKGTKYRISMIGPNLGWTRAPDARVVVASPAG
jgi:hypothetical protein